MARPDGRTQWLGVVFDVAAHTVSEARLKLLVSEIDHRVKNMLANLGAIARHTGQQARSVDEFVAALEGRMRALGCAHGSLSAGNWEGADLRALAHEILLPLVGLDGQRAEIKGDDVLLRPKAAQSLALALHELATNAAQHGALAQPGGRVSVSWRYQGGDGDETRLVIEWREAGGPPVSVPRGKGFGLTVLQNMIAHDLKAKVECTFPRAGAHCAISLPANVAATPHRRQARPADAPSAADAAGSVPARLRERRRILLVEDAWVLGVQLRGMLEVSGHEPIGPATTIEEAFQLAETADLDAAILDVRIGEADVFPVAEKLAALGVPFGFATGYTDDDSVPRRFRDAPRIAKPYSSSGIDAFIARLLGEEH
jgi:two-component sensor histidine kinase/CheY-like chemotaxis protein